MLGERGQNASIVVRISIDVVVAVALDRAGGGRAYSSTNCLLRRVTAICSACANCSAG